MIRNGNQSTTMLSICNIALQEFEVDILFQCSEEGGIPKLVWCKGAAPGVVDKVTILWKKTVSIILDWALQCNVVNKLLNKSKLNTKSMHSAWVQMQDIGHKIEKTSKWLINISMFMNMTWCKVENTCVIMAKNMGLKR